MTEQCSTCRFWRNYPRSDMGTCRRRSPTPGPWLAKIADLLGHISWASYQAAGINPESVEEYDPRPSESGCNFDWPSSDSEDWCGEYEPKAPLKTLSKPE